MIDTRYILTARLLYSQDDCDALLNVKNILVLASIRGNVWFLSVAVQVIHPNLAKALHQALTHSTKGWIVQVSVIGDKAQDAVPSSIYAPLSKANELYIVILQPLWISLAKGHIVNVVIVIE